VRSGLDESANRLYERMDVAHRAGIRLPRLLSPVVIALLAMEGRAEHHQALRERPVAQESRATLGRERLKAVGVRHDDGAVECAGNVD
jgi:hypothetical protein